jgi:hypothetical protein
MKSGYSTPEQLRLQTQKAGYCQKLQFRPTVSLRYLPASNQLAANIYAMSTKRLDVYKYA